MSAYIVGADLSITPDDKDERILQERVEAWDKRPAPRVGDYIMFSDGVMHRFSHDWDEWGLQTSKDGSFYFGDGYMSFSGGLNPPILREKVLNSGETKKGQAWFFHHDWAHAHSAVFVMVDCRVFGTAEKSTHWESRD